MMPPPEPAASDSSPHRSTTWRSCYGRLPLASTHGCGDCLAWLTCDGGSCPSLSASGGVEVLSSITTAAAWERWCFSAVTRKAMGQRHLLRGLCSFSSHTKLRTRCRKEQGIRS